MVGSTVFRSGSPQLGYNASYYNSTFNINGCSGLLSVADSSKLNYRVVQVRKSSE